MNAIITTIDRPKNILHIVCALVIIGIYGALAIIPRTFPVMWFERAGEASYGEVEGVRYVQFEVTAWKFRNCPPSFPGQRTIERDGKKILQQQATVKGLHGFYRETWMEFVDDESPNSSHWYSFLEPSSFGVWRFWYPSSVMPPVRTSRVPMIHLCGDDQQIPVGKLMGPFPIKPTLR